MMTLILLFMECTHKVSFFFVKIRKRVQLKSKFHKIPPENLNK